MPKDFSTYLRNNIGQVNVFNSMNIHGAYAGNVFAHAIEPETWNQYQSVFVIHVRLPYPQSVYKYAIEKYISDYPRDEGNSSRTEKPTAMISFVFSF